MRPIATLLALVAVASLNAAEGGGVRTSRFSGTVANVSGQEVTITKSGDSGSKQQSVTVTGSTQILIETDQVQPGSGEGKGKRVSNPGTIADLAVGDPVTATFNDDGSATQIVEHVPPKPKVGGEGR